MDYKIKRWFTVGTVFIIIFGSILHFVYEWSGNNPIVAIFGAVNESTWEHLKLLFWPAFIYSIIEYIFVGKNFNNYITAKAVSYYIGIFLIISIFYTYTGVFGDNYLIVDISIFIISVIISQYIGYRITTGNYEISSTLNFVSMIAIILLVLAFVLFTFYPPKIPLFQDPNSGEYGRPK